MRILTATEPGDPAKASEDWAAATSDLVVVLDGATARTDTGCIHGVAWYAEHLGAAIVDLASARSPTLIEALATSIAEVAASHPECDLTHPGTPSAGVGILRLNGDGWEYLVLGDVSIAIATVAGVRVVSDGRVSQTAPEARAEADRFPIGSPEKQAAMLVMKHGELAARNREGGYWIAAVDPDAARHALTGAVPTVDVTEIAALTDGAVRAVEFGLVDWDEVFAMFRRSGPSELLRVVREAERADPLGRRWPRNKASDDATAVYLGRI